MKQTEILTRATHVNGWGPAVYMSCMSQNFRLFHVSNLSVRNFRIFCSCIRGRCRIRWHRPARLGRRQNGPLAWENRSCRGWISVAGAVIASEVIEPRGGGEELVGGLGRQWLLRLRYFLQAVGTQIELKSEDEEKEGGLVKQKRFRVHCTYLD